MASEYFRGYLSQEKLPGTLSFPVDPKINSYTSGYESLLTLRRRQWLRQGILERGRVCVVARGYYTQYSETRAWRVFVYTGNRWECVAKTSTRANGLSFNWDGRKYTVRRGRSGNSVKFSAEAVSIKLPTIAAELGEGKLQLECPDCAKVIYDREPNKRSPTGDDYLQFAIHYNTVHS